MFSITNINWIRIIFVTVEKTRSIQVLIDGKSASGKVDFNQNEIRFGIDTDKCLFGTFPFKTMVNGHLI